MSPGHRVLTSEQLGQAVLVGRSTPGPLGAFVVAVGYLARAAGPAPWPDGSRW
jgi:hypothetical protein